MVNPHLVMVQERLQALKPDSLTIEDESHLHAGHAGSQGGASHLRAWVVSPFFENLSTVAQHRLVYDLLRDLIPFPIHALALHTRAPSKGNP